ncbi:hypothetical protein F8M41_010543 [Gigaspora margarita]|uniref:Uncharacterized protein n=1 Tax=Gigaspora margarita TaxID=4874 RepID=A0A8H3X3Q8_GIGMA|nr:hypothetical protein F8M41_010543 [Gigaspora margarita]
MHQRRKRVQIELHPMIATYQQRKTTEMDDTTDEKAPSNASTAKETPNQTKKTLGKLPAMKNIPKKKPTPVTTTKFQEWR